MKTKALLLAIAMVMVIFSCNNKSGTKAGSESTEQVQAPENIVTETPSFHKYGIKSGIVTFETVTLSITKISGSAGVSGWVI